MTLTELFLDKSLKAKAKTAKIGDWILNGELPFDELLAFAETQNPVNKATCIEALEYATKKKPGLADESLLHFAARTLQEEEPRIKWESAKVIANIAKEFPAQLTTAITHLLSNAEHTGTVVRWATASALGEILKLKTAYNEKLLPEVEKLCEKEADNGVKAKYLDALKKLKKK